MPQRHAIEIILAPIPIALVAKGVLVAAEVLAVPEALAVLADAYKVCAFYA
jgi:hypothetical protein